MRRVQHDGAQRSATDTPVPAGPARRFPPQGPLGASPNGPGEVIFHRGQRGARRGRLTPDRCGSKPHALPGPQTASPRASENFGIHLIFALGLSKRVGPPQSEHRTTKVGRPQSNGFIERFHRTLLEEHLRIKGRTTWYEAVAEMQKDLDAYLETYNRQRPHRGRGMEGRTPYEVFKAGIPRKRSTRKPAARKEVKPAA